MPNAFEALPKFSFDGIRFPWKQYEITGGIRDHLHEYPHAGVATEKLGRRLYEIKVTGVFDAGLTQDQSRIGPTGGVYSDLFPTKLAQLRQKFEKQTTGPLVIPHVGTIQCNAVTWSERASNMVLSGVDVEMTFREDMSDKFATIFSIKLGGFNLTRANWDVASATIKPKPSIFDKISAVAVDVLSIKDQIDLYSGLVAAKIEGLASLIQEADTQVRSLGEPENWEVLEALHDLMRSTAQLANDIQGKGEGLQVYTVPLTMSVAQLSTALYGDSSHATEIMQLNALNDPMAIPAGEKVVYYSAA